MKTFGTLPLLLLMPTMGTAFVPPRPGTDLAETYEPVLQYRKRLGISYNYTPTLLNPETCRYLSEQECEQADKSMQEHAQAHRDIQANIWRQRQRQRSLQENKEDLQKQLGAFTKTYGMGKQPTLQEELEELEQLLIEFNTTRDEYYQQRRRLQFNGPSDRTKATYNPSLGSFVVPLLLMRFTDHQDRPLPEMYNYQILWNLRIKKWIDENSYGKYTAFFDVQDWELTDNTEKHYSFGEYGRISAFQNSFWVLLDSMDERLGGDWSLYDADGDGHLDNLIVIHSGYAAEEGGVDCTNDRENRERIWSHAFSSSNGWTSSNGQYKVRGYNIAAGLDLKCDYEPGKMGVMTHEYMHTFYLIDLYDLQFAGKGLGNFDIMAYPYGHANTGYIPVNLSPWARQTVEWSKCTVIDQSGEYTLEPAILVDNCFKIVLVDFTGFEEYILLENRQQTSFDIEFWQPGLVMYHIDEGANDQMWTGYPGMDEYWPETGDHYRVAVIQADGNYDLEHGNNIGDKGDIWMPGMKLGPNPDGKTFPNTDGYQDGFIEPTGITIEMLEFDGMNVRIQVTMPTRSGPHPSRPAFSTPQKHHTVNPMAEDQFTVPDSEHQISGMIPQLPWFDEYNHGHFKESTSTFTTTERTSGGKAVSRQGYVGALIAALTTVLASAVLC